MDLLILGQNKPSLAPLKHFSIAKWLPWIFLSISSHTLHLYMDRVLFINRPSQIHSSSLKFQKSCNSGSTSDLFSGQPVTITVFSFDNSGSLSVSHLNSSAFSFTICTRKWTSDLSACDVDSNWLAQLRGYVMCNWLQGLFLTTQCSP